MIDQDGWISVDDYIAKTGESRTTISKRVSDGVWKRGVHYSAPDGQACYVHEARIAEWQANRRPPKTAEE
jgi:hypothetical protein